MHHKKNPQRHHTVPNSNYPSFPFYHHEKIEVKTSDSTTENKEKDDNNNNNFQVHMQDKLKMCFPEMQTHLKEQFDNRRRQFPYFKKKKMAAQSREYSSENQPTSGSSKIHVDNDSDKFRAHLIRTKSKDSLDDDQPVNVDKANVGILPPTTPGPYNRTSSSDMFSSRTTTTTTTTNGGQYLNFSNIYGPTYGSRPFRMEQQDKDPVNGDDNNNKNKKQQGFNEWLTKLEEINDMSRSTIDRIKRLENDIFVLRNSSSSSATERPIASSTTLQPPRYQTFASKIPVTTASSTGYIPTTNRIIKRKMDKSLNTDIDMEFMNKLLKYWESRIIDSNNNNNLNTRTTSHIQLPSKTSSIIRRLTTTISRSVKIQTDSEEEKSFEDRGVITDGTLFTTEETSSRSNQDQDQRSTFGDAQSTTVKRHYQDVGNEQQNYCILDSPIIEPPFVAKKHIFTVCSDNKMSDGKNILINVGSSITPEPIVEMYSDTDDNVDGDDESYENNFEDFEKNILNEINRRALIRNKIVSRSQTDFYHPFNPTTTTTTTDSSIVVSNKAKLKNSSTQTIQKPEETREENLPQQTQHPQEKKLQSTSKIIIERTRADQKEKKEIIVQTDIDKDGKVRRTTEIRNLRHNTLPMDSIKIENECFPPTNIEYSNVDQRNDVATTAGTAADNKMKQIFPSRTQSAFDLSDDLLAKTEDDFLSNKAFSSLDISSKSPVASEGYHSEMLDHTTNQTRLSTPQNYLIEPPESFRGTPVVDQMAKSTKDKNNYWIMNNETLIENIGNEMNITTRSSTTRNPTNNNNIVDEQRTNFPSESSSSTLERKEKSILKKTNVGTSSSNINTSRKLIDLNDDPPLTIDHNQQQSQQPEKEIEEDLTIQPSFPRTTTTDVGLSSNGCKLSVIYNNWNGTNVVFRADFGISKLPLYETNL